MKKLIAAVVVLWCMADVLGQAPQAPPQIDPKAEQVIRALSDHLKSLKSLSFSLSVVTRVDMQGKVQESTSECEMAVKRPNLFSVVQKSRPAISIVSDGKKMHTYVPSVGKQMVHDAPGDLDKLNETLRRSGLNVAGDGPSMVAELFHSDPYKSLMAGVVGGQYVELKTIEGTNWQHLKFQQEQFDWEIWVSEGANPSVRSVVTDFTKAYAKLAAVRPTFKDMSVTVALSFKDWKANPELGDDRFAFRPPPGTETVDALREREEEDEGPHPLLGKPAPDFALALLDGGRAELGKHKGKDVIVLDFWAAWCGPCIVALPILAETTEKLRDKGVAFYAVNQQDEPETIRKLLEERPLKCPIALDANGQVGQAYGVEALPQTVLIGKDGTVQVVHVGFSRHLAEEMETSLKALLEGKNLAAEQLARAPSRKAGRQTPFGIARVTGKPIPSGPEARTERDYRELLRKWHLRTTVEMYDKVGRRNPAWDAQARRYMERFAAYFGKSPDAPPLSELVKEGEALVALGCDDPVVRYYYGVALHLSKDPGRANGQIVNALGGFYLAKYPAIRRYAAVKRLIHIWGELERGSKEEYEASCDDLVRALLDSTADGSFVGEEHRLLVALILEDWSGILAQRRKALYEELTQRREVNSWVVKVVGGRFYIDEAWQERGGEWGYLVPEDRWGGFEEKIGKARALLTEAWQMEPSYPEAAAGMITVSMATEGLREVRLWFDRAVAGQIDYPGAYSRSIRKAFLPRWGGSHAEMYALGLECLETKRFDTGCPWEFLRAVQRISTELPDWRDAYRKPGVYEDLSRLFEGLIAEPTRASQRNWCKSRHALAAWACDRHEKAKAILDELGDQMDPKAYEDFKALPKDVVGEVRAFTGPVSERVRQAEELWASGKPTGALPVFEEALAVNKDDGAVSFYLRDRIARLRVELAVRGDQWVSLMPDSDLSGWSRTSGQWAVAEEGILQGQVEKAGMWMVSKARLGGNFEVRGALEVDPRREFHGAGSIALGYGHSPVPICLWLAVSKQAQQVSISGRSEQNARQARVQVRNTFLVQVWGDRLTAYLNGTPVFVDHHVPKDWWFREGGRIGLGATDRVGAVVRYRNLEIRGLQSRPEVVDQAREVPEPPTLKAQAPSQEPGRQTPFGVARLQGKPIPCGPEARTERHFNEMVRKWHLKTSVEAYDRVGGRNKAWDAQARQYMDRCVKFFTNAEDAPKVPELLKEGETLVALKCEDPIVRYFHGTVLHLSGDAAKAESELAHGVSGFDLAAYPAARTYAAIRRLIRVKRDLKQDAGPWYDAMIKQIAETAADGSFVGEERRFGLAYIFEDWRAILWDRRKALVDALKAKPEADPWMVKMVEAQWLSDEAWRERGSYPAGVISDDARKGFEENMAKARALFVEACEMEPNYPEAAAGMITVALATGGLKEARLWFDRSVAVQMDHASAYSNLLWAARPRWGGSHADMYAFGLECLDTKRFDTDVPWQLFEAVRGIAAEVQDLRSLGRTPGLYEDMSRLLEGMMAEPSRASRRAWLKSMYGLTASACARYDKAREVFDELEGQLDPDALRQFGATAKEALGEARACTGPLAAKIRQAEELDIGRRAADALPLFEQALAATKDDEAVSFYLRDRIAALRVEVAIRGDQWFSWMPERDLAGWQVLAGEWSLAEDGALEGRARGGSDSWAVSKACIQGNFELRGNLDLDERKEFYGEGSVVLGRGSLGDPVSTLFRVYRQARSVAIAKGYGNVRDIRRVAVEGKNTFLIQVWESRVTAYLNGMPVFVDHQVPDNWWLRQGGQIGVITNDREGAVVRYRNLQIRGLQRDPAGKR